MGRYATEERERVPPGLLPSDLFPLRLFPVDLQKGDPICLFVCLFLFVFILLDPLTSIDWRVLILFVCLSLVISSFFWFFCLFLFWEGGGFAPTPLLHQEGSKELMLHGQKGSKELRLRCTS